MQQHHHHEQHWLQLLLLQMVPQLVWIRTATQGYLILQQLF
jgi:hypothetical protein